MFQSTIHPCGVLILLTIGPKCLDKLSVNMTSLFWYLTLFEYASVHNEVMGLRITQAVAECLAQ
jgi:hypothetical protein